MTDQTEREALARLREAADRMSPLSQKPFTSLDLALVRDAAYRVADGTFRKVDPIPDDWEYRMDYGDKVTYSRTKSRADRALMRGKRVWRRVPERPAGPWLPVEQEGEQ